jgi:histidyl-tRNA synthetase
MQCDFDTIGTTSPVADLEMVLVVHDLLAAIGVGRFTIRLNDRRVLAGILARLGLAGRSTEVLRSLDKLGKAAPEAVAAELAGHGVAPDAVAALLEMAGLAGPVDAVLARLESLVGDAPAGQAGVRALREIAAGAATAGVPAGRLAVDPSIARGLDYYTGIVLETFLDDLPALGSVCSGGRYDNLAGLYTKQPLPGVGASLGIDRLLAGLEELTGAATVETPADVFLVHFDPAHLADYLRIAAALRKAGLAVEFFPEPKKVGQQLKLAAKRGVPAALVLGGDEFAAGTAQFKDMAAQTAETIAWHGDPAALAAAVRSQVAAIRGEKRD